ncbi:MAG: hypothetical protein GY913_25690 [Proteobacteria bacterium]|nr:hypothetical protein [Pseudomonadota bacterium]MCP4920308.1 hypothetical protein [Pseudomonadota bacterium]
MSLTAGNMYDFFSTRVGEAQEANGIELSEDASRYLALLLTESGRAERLVTSGAGTLAEMHLQAARSDRRDAMRLYRHLGDRALYMGGYFRERVQNTSMGLEYYADMGGSAYGQVATVGGGWVVQDDPWRVMFLELAEQFRDCLTLLSEVAETNLAEGTDDIVALYERWLLTRSPSIERRLRELGMITEAEPA